MITKIKLLDDKAVVPTRAHETDTGYDVTMIGVEKIVGDVIFFKTGFSIQPPSGHYYDVVPRSSISKLPLELANQVGVLDEHYRGEVLVAIRVTHPNMGQSHEFTSFANGIVKIFGKRPVSMRNVAQLILTHKPVLTQMILRERIDSEFVEVSDLSETVRGAGGFGSTDDTPQVSLEETVTKSSIRKEILSTSDETETEVNLADPDVWG
jgi:dUTPase